ncbi:MAG: hypothetical protein GXX85_17395 [Ignavibacteria bacterium]|nr:hypothetical protein [Ignavibacteria bacterium]
MMQNKTKNKLISAALMIVVILVIAFLVFNQYGIIKYIKTNNAIEKLDSEILNTEKSIETEQKEIDSLNNDDYKIEKVAREKFRMHKPNEESFIIEETQVEK